MERDNFYFKNSSRIYKQAASLAMELRQNFNSGGEWFKEAFTLLKTHGLTSLRQDAQWQEAIKLVKGHVDDVSGTIDPRIAIPALVEAVDNFYYRDPGWRQEIPICGSALKASIALIWPNRNSCTALDKSASRLVKLVSAVIAWEQLVSNYENFAVFNFGPVEFSSRGFTFSSGRDRWLGEQWNKMVAPYGEIQRTLNDSKSVILRDFGAFSDAVSRVLDGEKASSISLFAGTVFALVKECPSFWLGLKIRLDLLIKAALIKSSGSSGYTGIVLFESFPTIMTGYGSDAVAIQESVQQCFWQEHWYRKRPKDFISNMLVERPVLRIDGRTFVTSVFTILDSINGFVESSVFTCLEYGGAPIGLDAFQLGISQPFERATIEAFKNKGWTASGVSSTGYWSAGNCQLRHAEGKPMPGEIDVLAIHHSGLVALIVECKVLGLPFTKNKLTNAFKKLGTDDGEQFHSKIDKKVKWLRGVESFKSVDITGVLVVDQGDFLGYQSHNYVINLSRLVEILDKFEE